jgi:hypothetical protein
LYQQLKTVEAEINELTLPAAREGECSICLEMTSQPMVCECGQLACYACIRALLAMHKHKPSKIQCKCGRAFAFEEAVDDELGALYENFKKEVTAACADGKFCPTPDCQYHYIDTVPKENFAPFTCPLCKAYYCSHCLLPHDAGIRCDEARRKKERDDDSREWIEAQTQPCPSCAIRVQKNGGCNSLGCRCGAFFEWREELSQEELSQEDEPFNAFLPLLLRMRIPSGLKRPRPHDRSSSNGEAPEKKRRFE